MKEAIRCLLAENENFDCCLCYYAPVKELKHVYNRSILKDLNLPK